MKRLRDAVHDAREESRCAQLQLQTECDKLQRHVRELQTSLATERTAYTDKECTLVNQIEAARSEIAAAKRDEGLRSLALKEEVDARVRSDVEAFKRRYLQLEQGATRGLSEPRGIPSITDIIDPAETSLKLRVHRMRDWTGTVTTQHGGTLTTTARVTHGSLTARESLYLRSSSPQRRPADEVGLVPASRSASGMSVEVPIHRKAPSDTYHRMTNIADQLKEKLGNK